MKRLELTGQTFYKVAVLGFSYCKNQKTYWKCKCACGNIFDSRGDTIKRGEVRSCKKGSCHPGSIKTGEASFNHIYRIYQQSATIKNLSFSLTKWIISSLVFMPYLIHLDAISVAEACAYFGYFRYWLRRYPIESI